MEPAEHDGTGFDESAALEQLERFRQDIERYRTQRKAVSEEFDAFVRSFKAARAASATPSLQEPRPKQVNERRDERKAAVDPMPHSVVPAERQRRFKTPALVGGVLILLAGAGWATRMVGTRAPGKSAAGPISTARPAGTAADKPGSSKAPPELFAAELTATRPVWVRVTADGARLFERELPANTRVPLRAEKTIVIRAGNAGAVRLSLAGQDQGPLGPEGAVVTRTFTIPARR
jgi:Domain of unknown function (DUF4115)